MFDLIKKTMSTGLGLAFLTKEKIENLSKELVEKGELSKKDAQEFIDDLTKKSEDATKKLEEQIEKVVVATMKKMNLVTKDDLSHLEKQVKAMAKAVNERES